GRKGRMSPTRQRALDELVPLYLAHPPLATGRPIIVEIGSGRGDSTATMAAQQPEFDVIACEVNHATMSNLALLIDANELTNVRLWLRDAFEALAELGPRSVTEVRVWFPDPWPKPRHAHKRLVVPERISATTDALVIGGRLRIATDDVAYAEQALDVIERE